MPEFSGPFKNAGPRDSLFSSPSYVLDIYVYHCNINYTRYTILYIERERRRKHVASPVYCSVDCCERRSCTRITSVKSVTIIFMAVLSTFVRYDSSCNVAFWSGPPSGADTMDCYGSDSRTNGLRNIIVCNVRV